LPEKVKRRPDKLFGGTTSQWQAELRAVVRPERRVYRDDSPAQQRIAWEHFGVSFRVLLLDGGDLVHLGGGLYARLTRSDRLLDEMGGLALAAVFWCAGRCYEGRSTASRSTWRSSRQRTV